MNEINLKRKESQIHQLIANIVSNDLTNVNIIDPVVMDVVLTSDLGLVKVYVNLSGNAQKGLIALNNAASFIRKMLAKSLDWRKAPEIKFYLDDVSKTGERIDAILRKIHNEN
ncbi:ribosome-binding factor A [Mycoplasmopsis mustelae]|uniref:Ribosome-binding factor A n=1 Tax=Mycoplasmopsis mustelae TaxID=171289 RepID=A0A4R7UF91_9BACT|nr:30S ribosome-binding factor RbfA [Mycoplasmopsis mustelae]TDV24285.1 ribosome-binding factor A [Mycoplasmopsis mustelae]